MGMAPDRCGPILKRNEFAPIGSPQPGDHFRPAMWRHDVLVKNAPYGLLPCVASFL